MSSRNRSHKPQRAAQQRRAVSYQQRFSNLFHRLPSLRAVAKRVRVPASAPWDWPEFMAKRRELEAVYGVNRGGRPAGVPNRKRPAFRRCKAEREAAARKYLASCVPEVPTFAQVARKLRVANNTVKNYPDFMREYRAAVRKNGHPQGRGRGMPSQAWNEKRALARAKKYLDETGILPTKDQLCQDLDLSPSALSPSMNPGFSRLYEALASDTKVFKSEKRRKSERAIKRAKEIADEQNRPATIRELAQLVRMKEEALCSSPRFQRDFAPIFRRFVQGNCNQPYRDAGGLHLPTPMVTELLGVHKATLRAWERNCPWLDGEPLPAKQVRLQTTKRFGSELVNVYRQPVVNRILQARARPENRDNAGQWIDPGVYVDAEGRWLAPRAVQREFGHNVDVFKHWAEHGTSWRGKSHVERAILGRRLRSQLLPLALGHGRTALTRVYLESELRVVLTAATGGNGKPESAAPRPTGNGNGQTNAVTPPKSESPNPASAVDALFKEALEFFGLATSDAALSLSIVPRRNVTWAALARGEVKNAVTARDAWETSHPGFIRPNCKKAALDHVRKGIQRGLKIVSGLKF